MPKVLEFLRIVFVKFVQNIRLNLIFIKPGLIVVIASIDLSLSFMALLISLARSNGDLLLILDKNIAAFDEISQLNFDGGISVFIPSKSSGKIILPLLDKSKSIFLIFSKYSSNIFI